MPPILLAESFRTKYANLREDLPPALLLTGIEGIGLKYLAMTLSPHVEGVLEPLNSKGETDSTSGTISIEAIRGLYESTRSRGQQSAQIIIADADRMTKPAQQAFLKLLEEPPRGISFILTSHHQDGMLSTISSRVQKIIVPPITTEDSKKLVDAANLDDSVKRQLLFAADGRPGLLTQLINNPHERDTMISMVRNARDFIIGQDSKRLAVIFHYNDRKQALNLLDTALMLREYSLANHAKLADIASIARLLNSHRNIASGGNVRLNLLATMV